MMRCVFWLMLVFTAALPAVEIRVASFNVGAHFGETYFDYSLGEAGTPAHDTVKAILGRIDADVVALQEIHSADLPDDLLDLQTALGYPHAFVPTGSNVFDSTLHVVILSRYPFVTTGEIQSPPGARELTRAIPVVKVDVPGTTQDPVVIAVHLKSETGLAERFRRAVEMKRVSGCLAGAGLSAEDNFIILGDFNPSSVNTTFQSLPGGLPGSYVLGADLGFPIHYSTNPLAYFSSPTAVRLSPLQVDGSASTYNTVTPNGPVLDLILVSPAIAGRPLDSEIYNSALDVPNLGLVKSGDPLAASTSAEASDHYAIFTDIELDGDSPDLDLVLSAEAVPEGMEDGAVTATVILPSARASAVAVTIVSDDAASAMPVSPVVVIPAGNLSGNVALRVPRNFIMDAQRSVSLTASAPAYSPDSEVLDVNDVDVPYVFTAPGETIIEDFNGFAGNHAPAPWVVASSEAWRGLDDGTSLVPGLRSYGSAADGSLGLLAESSGTSASVVFMNQSGVALTALEVSLRAEQWRAVLNGAPHALSAELISGNTTIPLAGLSFETGQSLPGGAAPAAVVLTAMAEGLWIPQGSSFELRFGYDPAASGVPFGDVFVNELHYDNTGTDAGEFVEVAVGPAYPAPFVNLSLVLYDGGDQQPYGAAHSLGSFTVGAVTDSGHQLIHKMISGLQNGPDGIAIINTATSQVLDFISYEGSFTAASGPAAGMTSRNIGVVQNGTEVLNDASLGLAGLGGTALGFGWRKFEGNPHSPGQINPGQAFVVPASASQGLAIDDVKVVFLTDFDLDGIADSNDPDDDNDGQTDVSELVFGTDPLDAASRFLPTIARSDVAPHGFELRFPGAPGVFYTIEYSATLSGWQDLTSISGAGGPVRVALPDHGATLFFRVRAEN